MTKEQAKLFLEFAPKEREHNPDLLGFWFQDGNYICASCASRIMNRGCGDFVGAIPFWVGEKKKAGTCVGHE